MNPSTPRYSSDGGDASKFSFLGEQLTTYSSFQHNQQPSDSTGLSFSGASLSHSHAQATGQNLIPQSRQQPQELVGSNAASKPISLHQLVDFGMGSSGPILSAQLVHGLQESARAPSPVADASSQALMTTLLLLQQKIGHLQTLVQLIAQGDMSNASATQQQMTTAAGIATVISQLVTAAAGWLPQVHQQFQHPLCDQRIHFGSTSSPDMAFFQYNGPPSSLGTAFGISAGNGRFNSSVDRGRENNSGVESVVVKTRLDGSPEIGRQLFEAHGGHASSCTIRSSLETTAGSSLVGSFAVSLGTSGDGTINLEEEDIALCVGNPFVSSISMEINSSSKDQDPGGVYKEDEDDGEAENLPPGSYELIELEAIEILAEHTHFCEICGKGFKRDANLRMHMRGHGDEYKTVAALTKPDKSSQNPSLRKPRRYSCPYLGCKRNKKHRKFLPLKTMLCVKNHYRRSHCPKMLTCTKCRTKKFSVAADLKTHEKHCGRDKWQCSCGTTFSRKDKLLGHVGLFVGHAPATPLHEIDMGGSGMERTETQSASGNATTNICSQGFTK